MRIYEQIDGQWVMQHDDGTIVPLDATSELGARREARMAEKLAPEERLEADLDAILTLVREQVLARLPAEQMMLGANGIYERLAAVPKGELDEPFGASRWSVRRWGEILEALGSAAGGGGMSGWIQTPLPICGKTPMDVINMLD